MQALGTAYLLCLVEGKKYRKWVILLQWWKLQKYYIISSIENTQIGLDA